MIEQDQCNRLFGIGTPWRVTELDTDHREQIVRVYVAHDPDQDWCVLNAVRFVRVMTNGAGNGVIWIPVSTGLLWCRRCRGWPARSMGW